MRRWQAPDPVEIDLEKLKQKIGHLSVDSLDNTLADFFSDDSAGTISVRVLEKVAKAHTINEIHYDNYA